jgi:hypothetical protein
MRTPKGKKGKKGDGRGPAAPAGIYTNLTGNIVQFNYDREAEIEGFLLANNSLVHLGPRAAVQAANSPRIGDNVQVTGFAQTSPIGMQLVEALSVQDRTNGRTISLPQPGAAAPYSGRGRIQQLNYGPDGTVNGFLLDNGTLTSIPPYAASNPSSIQVGVTVSYSGYARRTVSNRIVVDVQAMYINGQQLTFGAPGPGGPAREVPPPPAQGLISSDRTAEPPPPPPPPR